MRSFLRRLLFETEVSGRTAAGRAGRQSGSPDGAAEERAQKKDRENTCAFSCSQLQ
mgnify:CR=1 FL=1|jgi:hypothetical protein